MNNTANLTIGYRSRFPEVFEKYLGKSLAAAEGKFDVIRIEADQISDCKDFSSVKYPAENYNEIMGLCQTPYLALVHEDISFTSDFVELIEDTIKEYPDFGAIGLVGASLQGNKWSEHDKVHEVHTLDSCCIIIRLDMGLKFDHIIFGELHLYVEDYCARARNMGTKIYTIKLKKNSEINHHSATWQQLGACWGNYNKYLPIFRRKYPGVRTT